MRPVWAFIFLAQTGAAKEVEDASTSPVQKVLQMMSDMKMKGLNEKQAEEVTFSKFSQFCTDTSSAKATAIQNGKDKVEQLSADIMKFNSDAKVLSEEIFKLDSDITTAEKDKSEATAMRKSEHADFLKTQADYVENIADLEEALTRLKTMMASSPGASASLLQTMVINSNLNTNTKRVLASFLQSTDTELLAGLEVTAPEASVFESQSGGIVDMVEKLGAKLQDEKSQLESEEMSASHSFDMMTQSLTDTIEQHLQSRNSKVVTKKQAEEASGSAKGDLADTQQTLVEDTKYLEDLKITCESKTQDFAARQKLRGEEIQALEQAIEIIADGSVAGSAETHLGFIQKKASLVQLRSGSRKPTQQLVQSFLKAQGQRLGSNLLSALAMRVGDDQFGKVKKMIKDMVVKLMEEATEEAEHKGFCDTELSTNKQTRDAKSTLVDELTASLEELQATSKQLMSEVHELSEEVTNLDAAVASATSVRNEEKAKNKATMEDATVAKLAVEKAMRVLTLFYNKAAKATSLVQTKTKQPVPETFDKPFTGMGGEGGILGMLEVILSDFERLARETEETESVSQKDYEAFMADSQEDKAVKNADIKHKQSKNVKITSDIAATRRDLKNTQEELSAAMSYFEKLKPSCVDAGESYEERVQRRKDEIQSLQESLKILTGEEVA